MTMTDLFDDGETHLRAVIRDRLVADQHRICVLDDDPTGSQSVNGVSIVTTFDKAPLETALEAPGSTCFVLTNTRSLHEPDARAATATVARAALEIEAATGAPVELVSRSDSTLRGHVFAELDTIEQTRREVLGRGYDGIIFAPAFLEAGRFTEDNIHYARLSGAVVPVGETEFARDATFGYQSSDLRDFLAEVSGGRFARDSITALSLEDIRDGGPGRVAERLGNLAKGAPVVINATRFSDLETCALGMLEVSATARFAIRSGPSFVRALGGIEPRPPLSAADIYPNGKPRGHGLIVVGSHVGLTNAQLAGVAAHRDLPTITLGVDATSSAASLARCADALRDALADSDALLVSDRTLRRGDSPEASLTIARQVSAGLVEVVRKVRDAELGFVLAKGGITSHDIAVRALEIRRATVVGQLLYGMVSVFRPIEAPAAITGVPYVVFAGNVGDEHTLDSVLTTLDGEV
jgi:uncharacterized protein YgbK (DUF1537 family)